MQRVDYDSVASEYDRRYDRNRFDGVESCLRSFICRAPIDSVAEVGCGTGHWLRSIDGMGRPCRIAGLDLSAAMLARARETAPSALLVRGSAHQLPWADGAFDRLFCINALHHFTNQEAFFLECARVLRPGGGFLSVGLDPQTGLDTWWVYDYFPGALAVDRVRYPSAAAIRAQLLAAGFRTSETSVAQHLPAAVSFEKAATRGIVDRRATSQLMVIADEEWAAGLARLNAERPVLRADLRLYATTAWT